MHRAEKSSSKVCRDRELDAARTIHYKKLCDTRSSIDTSKPLTSSMHHMTHNKRKERILDERVHEIEKHNEILVNRMSDVLNCSTWEFHPSKSVEDVSYTVYHSPRHSPRKPTAPTKTKKTLHETYRTKKLKQIEAENASHKERLRSSTTHYKNRKLIQEWKQSVKYLKSICAFPVLTPSKNPIPMNDRFEYSKPVQPLIPDDALDQDNLLDFYNLSLPTINVKEKISPPTLPSPSNPRFSRFQRGIPQAAPSFQPKNVGKRPGLPSLDPLSPRFKWGPRGFPKDADDALELAVNASYIFKQCLALDGKYFVITVKSGQGYGMNVVGYDSDLCRSYDLAVSKDHIHKILRDCVSIREEFSVKGISQLLCDKLVYLPNVLYIPIEESIKHVVATPSAPVIQSSIFCMFHTVPLLDGVEGLNVSVSSTESGGVQYIAEHPTKHEKFILKKTSEEILKYLKDHKAVPTFSTLEAAAVALLPFLIIDSNSLTCQRMFPESKLKCMAKMARQFGEEYYIVQVFRVESCDVGVLVRAYNPETCHSLELSLPSIQGLMDGQLAWDDVAMRIQLDIGSPKRLRYIDPLTEKLPLVNIPTEITQEKNVDATKIHQAMIEGNDVIEQQAAASAIQSTMRAARTRKLYLEKKQAAHVIKTTYLRRLHQKKRAKRRQHQIKLCLPSSPTKEISNICSELPPDCVDETAVAAVAIQSLARGYIARKGDVSKAKYEQEVVSHGISKIQARIRGIQTRRRQTQAGVQKNEAATRIQAHIRGAVTRRRRLKQ